MEICGFEHLHCHSDFSLLDGFQTVEEAAERAQKINQKYLTISDHGMMGVIPRQIRACEKICDEFGKETLSPIFACELYVNPLQPESSGLDELQVYQKGLNEEEIKMFRASPHLLAIAYNEIGYKNLVKLSSWGWTKGFYRKPRINHEQLVKHKEGIYFTSCCYNSEVGRAFNQGGEEAGFQTIEKYIEMVGKDHYFLEIMLLDFKKQKPYDAFIIKAHEKYNLPIILTNDCHYCNEEDSKYQRLMLMVQTQRTIQEIEKAMKEDEIQDFFELQDKNLWMKSEEELNEKWAKDYQDVIPYEIFCEAKRNTVKICEKAKGVKLDRSLKLPQLPDADEKLKEEVMRGFTKRNLPKTPEYLKRIKEEYSLITRKGFSSYFLIQKMMIDEARKWCKENFGGDGTQASGPGRGCLAPTVLIQLSNGFSKEIKDIVVGDWVICRDGVARQVKNTMSYPVVDEDLLIIKSYYGDNRGVILTEDHKVLVEKGKRVKNYENWTDSSRKSKKTIVEPSGNLEWIEAGKIELGDWVFVPKPEVKLNSIEKFDLAEFVDGKELVYDEEYVYKDYINPLTGNKNWSKVCKRYIELDEDFMQIVGYFAGDGWLRADLKSNYVGFAICSEDKNIFEFFKNYMNRICVDFSYKKHATKKLIQFFVRNNYFTSLFRKLFNFYKSTPETKHIPEFVFCQTDELRTAFLKGYFLADGHQSSSKISFDTKSIMLASQVRFLLFGLGYPASLNYGKRFDKRSGKKSFCYKINTISTLKIGFKDAEKLCFYRKIEGGFLTRVRSISLDETIDKVYDFEVEGEHNYLTSSFLVHNSAAGALTCYCLGITDVDPVYEGLLFSRFLSENRGGRSICLEFKNIDPLPAGETFYG